MENKVFIGGGGEGYGDAQGLTLKYANRHGLIAGATGTGKTFTSLKLVERMVPVGGTVVVPRHSYQGTLQLARRLQDRGILTVRAVDASGNATLKTVAVTVSNIDEVGPAFTSPASAGATRANRYPVGPPR